MKTPLPFVILAGMAASLAGCGALALSPATVTCIIVPPLPHPAVRACGEGEGVAWSLLWIDETGREHVKEHLRGETFLRLSWETVTPILLWEETALPGFAWGEVPPAGALLPLDAREGRASVHVYPDRQGGICASVAARVISSARGGRGEGKRIVDRFNWERLRGLVSSLERPHRVDREGLASLILSGTFSSRAVREGEVYSRRITFPDTIAGDIPAESVLYGTDPGEAPLRLNPDGSLLAGLREGHNLFFGETGSLMIQTREGRVDCTFFRSYDSMDP